MTPSVTLVTSERDGTDPLPLSAFGTVRGVRYSSTWPGGCDALSCTLDLGLRDNPRAALEGRRLTAFLGPVRIWAGLLNEVNRGTPWTLKAEGLGVQAVHTQAIVNTGDLTYQVSQHVNYAITRGALLGWQPTTVAAVPNLPTGPVYNLTTIADLLNLSTASNGRRWGVDAFGRLTQPVVPTTPDLLVLAPVAPFGRSLDGFATHIAVDYLNETDTSGSTVSTTVVATTDANVTNRFGRVEAKVDVSKYGLMNASEAASVVGGLLSLIGPRASFTGKIPLTYGSVLDAGSGVPVHPSRITAGQLVRFCGSQPGLISGEVGRALTFDVLLGDVEYDHDLEAAVVAPVQTKARDLAGVLKLITDGEREQAFDLAAS